MNTSLGRDQVGVEQHKRSYSWKFVTVWLVLWLSWITPYTGPIFIIVWLKPAQRRVSFPLVLYLTMLTGTVMTIGANKSIAKNLKVKFWEKNVHIVLEKLQYTSEGLKGHPYGQSCVYDQGRPQNTFMSYLWLKLRLSACREWRLRHWGASTCMWAHAYNTSQQNVWGIVKKLIRKYICN